MLQKEELGKKLEELDMQIEREKSLFVSNLTKKGQALYAVAKLTAEQRISILKELTQDIIKLNSCTKGFCDRMCGLDGRFETDELGTTQIDQLLDSVPALAQKYLYQMQEIIDSLIVPKLGELSSKSDDDKAYLKHAREKTVKMALLSFVKRIEPIYEERQKIIKQLNKVREAQ